MNGILDIFHGAGYRYYKSLVDYGDDDEAFQMEATEFDDIIYTRFIPDDETTPVNLQLYDNSWKRGYVTREEIWMPANEDPGGSYATPLQTKIYHYTMTPIKTR